VEAPELRAEGDDHRQVACHLYAGVSLTPV
jgi:hypothetical protein